MALMGVYCDSRYETNTLHDCSLAPATEALDAFQV